MVVISTYMGLDSFFCIPYESLRFDVTDCTKSSEMPLALTLHCTSEVGLID